MNFNMFLPGLEDVLVTKMEKVEDRIVFHVEMEELTPHSCPSCLAITKKVHDYRIQKIKHLKIFERLSVIFYRKRRYVCSCGKKFIKKILLLRGINDFQVNVRLKFEAADIYGTSSSTIVRRFDQLAESEITEVRELPKVIGIDEYKGDTREGKYQLIIADSVTKEPIDILPNCSKKTIKHYLQ